MSDFDAQEVKCKLCPAIFTDPQDYEQHKLVHGEYRVHCKYCALTFLTTDEYQAHVYDRHQCNICHRTFQLKHHLKAHLVTHTGLKPFKCDICDRGYSTQGSLKTHLATHTGVVHKCTVCKKVFTSSNYLSKHMKLHTEDKCYLECPVCKKTFATECYLRHHMLTHTGQNILRCDVCKRQLASTLSFKKHMSTHEGNKDQKCPVCTYICTSANSLQSHVETHMVQGYFICDLCNEAFSNPAHLKAHKMANHSGDKPNKCTVCGMEFQHPAQLKTHILTHTDERPFECDVCDKRFQRFNHLQRHISTVHSKPEKMFKCEGCGKKCSDENDLKQHKITHTGEKPFQCDTCLRKFKQYTSLDAHKSVHVNGKMQDCHVCNKVFLEVCKLQEHTKEHLVKCEDSENLSDDMEQHIDTIQTQNEKYEVLGESKNESSNENEHKSPTGSPYRFSGVNRMDKGSVGQTVDWILSEKNKQDSDKSSDIDAMEVFEINESKNKVGLVSSNAGGRIQSLDKQSDFDSSANDKCSKAKSKYRTTKPRNETMISENRSLQPKSVPSPLLKTMLHTKPMPMPLQPTQLSRKYQKIQPKLMPIQLKLVQLEPVQVKPTPIPVQQKLIPIQPKPGQIKQPEPVQIKPTPIPVQQKLIPIQPKSGQIKQPKSLKATYPANMSVKEILKVKRSNELLKTILKTPCAEENNTMNTIQLKNSMTKKSKSPVSKSKSASMELFKIPTRSQTAQNQSKKIPISSPQEAVGLNSPNQSIFNSILSRVKPETNPVRSNSSIEIVTEEDDMRPFSPGSSRSWVQNEPISVINNGKTVNYEMDNQIYTSLKRSPHVLGNIIEIQPDYVNMEPAVEEPAKIKKEPGLENVNIVDEQIDIKQERSDCIAVEAIDACIEPVNKKRKMVHQSEAVDIRKEANMSPAMFEKNTENTINVEFESEGTSNLCVPHIKKELDVKDESSTVQCSSNTVMNSMCAINKSSKAAVGDIVTQTNDMPSSKLSEILACCAFQTETVCSKEKHIEKFEQKENSVEKLYEKIKEESVEPILEISAAYSIDNDRILHDATVIASGGPSNEAKTLHSLLQKPSDKQVYKDSDLDNDNRETSLVSRASKDKPNPKNKVLLGMLLDRTEYKNIDNICDRVLHESSVVASPESGYKTAALRSLLHKTSNEEYVNINSDSKKDNSVANLDSRASKDKPNTKNKVLLSMLFDESVNSHLDNLTNIDKEYDKVDQTVNENKKLNAADIFQNELGILNTEDPKEMTTKEIEACGQQFESPTELAENASLMTAVNNYMAVSNNIGNKTLVFVRSNQSKTNNLHKTKLKEESVLAPTDIQAQMSGTETEHKPIGNELSIERATSLDNQNDDSNCYIPNSKHASDFGDVKSKKLSTVTSQHNGGRSKKFDPESDNEIEISPAATSLNTVKHYDLNFDIDESDFLPFAALQNE